MDRTTLEAQLFATGLKQLFLSCQICWLRKIRSVEKFRFDCQWKQWQACFCCLLDLSSGVISRASFSTFLQLPAASEIRRIYVVPCFKLVAGILHCNFFVFYMQLLSIKPIAQNVKVLFKKKHALELFQYCAN